MTEPETKQIEEGFDSWAIVELMGHRQFGAKVSETIVAGKKVMRCDIPAANGLPAFTQLYSPDALYCLTPTTEANAKAFHQIRSSRDIIPFELQAPAALPEHDDDDDLIDRVIDDGFAREEVKT